MNNDKYENNMDEEKEKPSIIKEIMSWIMTFAFAIIFAFFITKFIIVNAVIPSASMETTIMTGDRIIANRVEYYLQDPERYDIAVFKFPDSTDTLYIKRVIGMPGDKVKISDNQIYINDSTEALEDSFINGKMSTDNAVYNVPEKGDNIYDYREFIKDQALYDKDGDGLFDEDCYFMMGDNRNNSADSRVWNNKFVPKSLMQGKAVFRYYPVNKMKVIKNDF
ncbi:MAG: signal peptidase I [Clostridia bacterium]|nr:signal peptidase I [Clostridia bacterium]